MQPDIARQALLFVLILSLAAFRAGSGEDDARSEPSSHDLQAVSEVMTASRAVEMGDYRIGLLREHAMHWKTLRRFDQALHLLGPVRVSDQATGEDFFQTGYLNHRLRRFEQALDAYGQAIVMDPTHPEAHYNLALLLQRIGDVDGAVQHFEEVLRMRPAYEPTYFDLAMLLLTADRRQEAEGVLGRYLVAGTDSLALWEASEILQDLKNAGERDGDR